MSDTNAECHKSTATPRKEFKSELEYLRHFEKTASHAALGMLRACYALSLGANVLDQIVEKTELTNMDSTCLYALLDLFKTTIDTVEEHEASINDFGIYNKFPRERVAK